MKLKICNCYNSTNALSFIKVAVLYNIYVDYLCVGHLVRVLFPMCFWVHTCKVVWSFGWGIYWEIWPTCMLGPVGCWRLVWWECSVCEFWLEHWDMAHWVSFVWPVFAGLCLLIGCSLKLLVGFSFDKA
jgi:hypothetical protein